MAETKGGMLSPYATIHDPPVYESRPEAVVAPWFKEEREILTGRSHDPEAFMPCNSQTAPFATFHNVPQSYEYVGPLPEAPWNKEIEVHPTHRGQQLRDQYYYTTPFGTSDNYQQPRPSSQLPSLPLHPLPICGSDRAVELLKMRPGTKNYRISYLRGAVAFTSAQICRHLKLPHLQRPKILRSRSSMTDLCRTLLGTRTRGLPTSKKALRKSFSKTSHTEPPKTWITNRRYSQSTREIDVAPWNKVQPEVMSGKTCYDCGGSANSHTAPYATFDNRTAVKPNKKTGFQAPWDRDEVHYNRLPPKPLFYSGDDGPFNAPYATEPR